MMRLTPRRAGSKKDPYVLFEKRLNQGDPPNDWNNLVKQAKPQKKYI